jgi:WD40 repeat protein
MSRRSALVCLSTLLAFVHGDSVWGIPRSPGRKKVNQAPPGRTDLYGDPLPPGAIARFGSLRFRPGGQVYAIAFTPDGKTLASASSDQTVRLWEAKTGREIRRLLDRKGEVFSLSMSSDGKLLAAAGERGIIWVWETTTWKRVRRFRGHQGWVRAVRFSPDGKLLATGGFEGVIRLWDVAAGKVIRRFRGHKTLVDSLSFSPDGRRLVSGACEPWLCLWDVAAGKEIRRWEAGVWYVGEVTFSPNGKLVASVGHGATVHLWDSAIGKAVREWRGSQVNALQFSPDGKTLAVAGPDVVRFHDVASGKEDRRFRGRFGSISSLAFRPDGKVLAGGGKNCIGLWRVATRKEVGISRGNHLPLHTVACSPDGNVLATGGEDGTVRLWQPMTGKEVRRWNGHRDGVRALAFGSAGNNLVSAGGHGTARVWALTTGKELYHFGHLAGASRHAFFCTAIGQAGRTVGFGSRLWDAVTGKELRKVGCANGSIDCLAFSRDEKTLATGDGYEFEILEVATGKCLRSVKPAETLKNLCALALSPDGKTLAVACRTSPLRLWDLDTSRELPGLTRPLEATAVLFSPDGRTLAAGDSRGTVRVLETATWQERCRFSGHQACVSALAFSADGKTLASVSWDGTALLWDLTPFRDKKNFRSGQRENLWKELGHPNPARAYQAMGRLAHPQAVAFLKKRLQLALSKDPALARLIADLDSCHYRVRRKATLELARRGHTAEGALRRALAAQPSLEVRHRISRLLARLNWRTPGGEALRLIRSLELLESIGTREARQLLKTLARGIYGARVKREARAALGRLAKRGTGVN